VRSLRGLLVNRTTEAAASPETIRPAHAVAPINVVQTEYSLFQREPETGMQQVSL
jgi:aryl-alcohol dehydrogenase-like predicted oxidoreductase